MIVVAIAVSGWIGYELSRWPGEPPEPAGSITTGEDTTDASAPEAEPGDTAPSEPSEPQRFSLLSDGLAVLPGSWLNRVLRNGADENVVTGAVASVPGSAAADLAPQAQQTSNADVLVVQAGRIDLINGSAPNRVITDLQACCRRERPRRADRRPRGGLGDGPAARGAARGCPDRQRGRHDLPGGERRHRQGPHHPGRHPGGRLATRSHRGRHRRLRRRSQAQAKAARVLVAETLADLATE